MKDLFERLEAGEEVWLDAEPGPALPCSELELERLLDRSLGDWAQARPRRSARGWWAVAAAALVVLGIPSAWAMRAAYERLAASRGAAAPSALDARRAPSPRETGEASATAPPPVEARETVGEPREPDGAPAGEAPSPAPPPGDLAASGAAEPSASGAAEPSASGAAEPSASGAAEPSASGAAEPSASGAAEPSASGAAEPSASGSAEPSPSGPAEPAARGPSPGAASAPVGRSRRRAPERSEDRRLAEASRLRRERAWGAAAHLYGRLRRRSSDPGMVHVAGTAEGGLRLEHLGDPKGALAAFRSALEARPRGPLAPEARLGEADALAALGRSRAARGAWRQILRLHPNTPAARAAAGRLEGDP